jgi:hypothetical protein
MGAVLPRGNISIITNEGKNNEGEGMEGTSRHEDSMAQFRHWQVKAKMAACYISIHDMVTVLRLSSSRRKEIALLS